MYIIGTKIEDIITDFPIVDKWLETISKDILCEGINKESINSAYTFILVKTKNDRILEMDFDERLSFELSKVRINVDIQIGKKLLFSNRLPKGVIPKSIIESISNLTKIKIIIETSINNNFDVRKTIPDIENYAMFIEKLEEQFNDISDYTVINKDVEYNMDDILDKISSEGMESLTKDELNFLKSKSE